MIHKLWGVIDEMQSSDRSPESLDRATRVYIRMFLLNTVMAFAWINLFFQLVNTIVSALLDMSSTDLASHMLLSSVGISFFWSYVSTNIYLKNHLDSKQKSPAETIFEH